jgi:hypothetical protein
VGVTVAVAVAVGVRVAVGVAVFRANGLPPEQAESSIDPKRIGKRYRVIIFIIMLGGVYSIREAVSKRLNKLLDPKGFLQNP